MLADEIDELAQKIRIKLWRISQKEHIFCPRAYINRVAHNEAIDMVRKYKSTLPLPTDEDGEFYQGNLLVTHIEGMLDPARSLEQQEEIIDRVTRAIEDVLLLPLCQRYALICTIKNQIEDILPLPDASTKLGVDIETINWPSEKEAVQRLRASLSVARKKLRSLKDH